MRMMALLYAPSIVALGLYNILVDVELENIKPKELEVL